MGKNWYYICYVSKEMGNGQYKCDKKRAESFRKKQVVFTEDESDAEKMEIRFYFETSEIVSVQKGVIRDILK